MNITLPLKFTNYFKSVEVKIKEKLEEQDIIKEENKKYLLNVSDTK